MKKFFLPVVLAIAHLSFAAGLPSLNDLSTQQDVDREVFEALKKLETSTPESSFVVAIQPLAIQIKETSKKLADWMVNALKQYLPYRLGFGVTVFLEAGLHDHAQKLLGEFVQSKWAQTKTTDMILAAAMVQLAQVAVFAPTHTDDAVRLFTESPYNFCDKIYSYGGVLHLLVPFVIGYGTADIPEIIVPGLYAFACSLIAAIKKTKPELFTVKNISGETAQETVRGAAKKNLSIRPIAAKLLYAISDQL